MLSESKLSGSAAERERAYGARETVLHNFD